MSEESLEKRVKELEKTAVILENMLTKLTNGLEDTVACLREVEILRGIKLLRSKG